MIDRSQYDFIADTGKPRGFADVVRAVKLGFLPIRGRA